MGHYLLKRLLQAPLVLLVLITASFFLMRLAPGGPFDMEKEVPPRIEARMKAKYHLDEAWVVQYGIFLRDLVFRLDLGPSFKYKNRTVNEILAQQMPYSLLLGAGSLLIAVLLGVPAGVVGALRQNSVFDHTSMAIAMLGLALPTFVVGPLLQLVFAQSWGLLPVGQLEGPTSLLLPSVTLALPFAARIARLMRAGMLDVVHQDYIRTAWAKGLRERVIVVRHALRGGILPVVSFMGPGVAFILTGSLVVEKIFLLPGIGKTFIDSALNRDYTLAMGTVILFGVLIVLFNLAVDILYGFLDPRIRYK